MGSSDPILTTLKDFSYNVVRIPRTGIRPLQLLVKRGNDLTFLGEITELFRPGGVPVPALGPDEQAAFINGKRSRDLELSVGLSLLGGIIGAMTGTKLDVGVGYKRAKAVAFEFNDVKQSQISQIQLSRFLTAATIDSSAGPPARMLEEDQVYVITSTIKSTKFTTEATAAGGVAVNVDVPVIQQIVGGRAQVNTAGTSQAKVTYEGAAPLIFGFQAVRLEFEGGRLIGLKQVKSDEGALRALEAEYEMLELDSPFANLKGLPEDAARAPRKPAAKKAAKKPAKKATAKKAAKKAPAKKAAKAPAKKAAKKPSTKATKKATKKAPARKAGARRR